METIYPGYSPMLILTRPRPLSDIQNSEGPSPFFDDKLIVVDATRSNRGEVRGTALPLLLDLPRKTALLMTIPSPVGPSMPQPICSSTHHAALWLHTHSI